MLVNYNQSRVFPEQNLTDAEKIDEHGSLEEWGIANIEAIENSLKLNTSYYGNYNYREIDENLRMIEEGDFDAEIYAKLSSPHDNKENGRGYSYPVDVEHYDLFSSKVNLLVGEEIAKGNTIGVYNRSAGVASKAQQNKTKLVYEYIEQLFAFNVNKVMTDNGQEPGFNLNFQDKAAITSPDGRVLDNVEDIVKYSDANVSDLIEITGNHALKWARTVTNSKFHEHKGFIKFLCSDVECYRVDKVGGKPDLEVVDPRNLAFELPYTKDFIQDSPIIRHVDYIDASSIHGEFYDVLEEEDVDEIEAMKQSGYYNRDGYSSATHYVDHLNGQTTVRIARYEWEALAKIGIVSRWDQFGRETKDIVHEDYKVDKENESIVWYWVPERWEGVKIGDNIYVNIQPIEGQFEKISDIGKNFSRYIGYRGHYPFLNRIKVYNKLYDMVMYMLLISMMRAKGKGLIFDISQIPKKSGWTPEKWMHYFDFHGLFAVNLKERNEQGEVSGFNQWKEYDLTMGDAIQSYINQLEYIERKIDDLTGITPQREGNIMATETVGGVERSVSQSSAITEIYSFRHRNVMEAVNQKLLDVTQSCLNDDESYAYISDDVGRVFFTVTPGFSYADLAVFSLDSRSDENKKSEVKEILKQNWAQKEMDVLDLIKVIRGDSIAEYEQVAREARKNVQAQQKEQSEQELQAQRQAEEQIMKLKQIEIDLKRMELEIKRYDIDKSAETDVEVAKIRAQAQVTGFRPDVNPDANSNNVLDVIEERKMDLEQTKLMLEKQKHEDDVDLRREEIRQKKTEKQQSQ